MKLRPKTNEQRIKWQTLQYLARHMYGDAMVYDKNNDREGVLVTLAPDVLGRLNKHWGDVHVKAKLRSLDSMTPDEALALCKFSAPDLYGDFRFNKWKAELTDEIKDGTGSLRYYTVKRAGTHDFFMVDLLRGDVSYHSKTECEACGNLRSEEVNAYLEEYRRDWLIDHEFDIPLYPDGKTMLEMGIAIIVNPKTDNDGK